MCTKRHLNNVWFAGMALVAGAGAAARADTIYSVCPSGPADYDNIQACINAATDGDVCELCDATFSGTGNYNIDYQGKWITVRSQSGNPEDCIIDVGNLGTGFWFKNDEDYHSVLQGVTIMNGSGTGGTTGQGGAIRCGKAGFPPFDPQKSGSPLIEDCILMDSHAVQGGGMACTHDSNPELVRVTFLSNATSGLLGDKLGGGLYVHDSDPFLWDCDFIDNVVGGSMGGAGGGIFLEGSLAHIEFSRFSGNSAVQGGGIYSYGSRPVITSCTFSGNDAGAGGGGIMLYGNTLFDVEISWCTLYGNAASTGGGIALSNGASADISNTIIAMGTAGEAVSCFMSASPSLTCCDVYGNADGDWVGCIAGQDANLSLHNLSEYPGFCDPENEDFTVRDVSPCIPPAPPDSECGAMIGVWPFAGCSGPLTWSVCPTGSADFSTIQAALDAALSGDTIELCPAIYSGDGNRDLDYGGKSLTVRCQTGDPADCTINCGGTPGQPHRGFYFHSGESTAAVLQAVTITNGYAAYPGGGGILCDGAAPTITNCVIHDNDTANEGGGMYCNDGAPVVQGCAFEGNYSVGLGGGMLCGGSCSAQISECTFVDNIADDDGGGIAALANVNVQHCTFEHNHAAGHGGGMTSMTSMGTPDPTIAHCVFTDNSAGNAPNWGAGGGLALFHFNYFEYGQVIEWCTFANNTATSNGGGVYLAPDTTYARFDNCTFYGNAAPVGGAANFDYGACGEMNHTIVSFSAMGGSVVCDECPIIPMECCDVYGNVGGDWISCIASNAGTNGNISLDPQFCDAATGDFRLEPTSPCAPFSPPNAECDLIGAWPVCAEDPCVDLSDCADRNDDRMRDDECVWWACEAGNCVSTAITFADVGGDNGSCPPDGITDSHDRFHVLNCFTNQDTLGNPLAYPCEPQRFHPGNAYNVDAGGPYGSCIPDGVADANDVFHVLNTFSGTTTCSCPLGESPLPQGPAEALTLQSAEVELVALRDSARPGELVEVDAYLTSSLADLRGYQLHLAVGGGRRGGLELVDIAVDPRRDHVFAGLPDWRAFNLDNGQMLAGLDHAGVAVKGGGYLATFTYRVGKEAAGTFAIELLCSDQDPGQRTFLFPTPHGGRVAVSRAAQP